MRRTRRGHFGGAIVAGAAATAACTLLTPVDGLSDDPPSVTDAASADGTSVDVAASDVAAGDASIPFCATTDARFCDDFERDTLQGTWSEVRAQPNAEAAQLVSDGGNRYFASSVRYAADAAPPYGFLARNYSSSVASTTAVFAFKMYLHAYASPGGPCSDLYTHAGDGGYSGVGLNVTGTTVVLYEENSTNGLYRDFPLDEPIVPGRWYAVVLSVDYASSPQRLTLTIDGKPSVSVNSVVGHFTGGPSFNVGFSSTKNTPALDVDIDDVTIQF